MPTIDAIISDLDDTLLNAWHQLTERTERTLKRLLDQNVKVILASGRSAASIRPIVERIGTPCPYIAYNGAQIVDSQTHEVLAASELPLALARDVLRWFEARGVHMQYYQGDDWYVAATSELSEAYGRSSGIPGIAAGMPLSEHIAGDTPKLLGIHDAEGMPALIEASRQVFGDRLMITTSKPYFIEITSPQATKGNAVQRLAGMIGLSPETTICAGDSLNDVSMLEWSKLPVTVANGRDEVKRIAWQIGTEDNDHDGLALLLDELIPPKNATPEVVDDAHQ